MLVRVAHRDRNGLSVRTFRGMSLIELLVVIAVLGVISAIFIPNIENISSQARFAKDERNAQNIASLLAAAKGAGAPQTWTNAADAVEDLVGGISVDGPGGTMEFKISELSEEELNGASAHLDVSDGMVFYHLSRN